jgi:hypothetical protein
MTLTTVIRNATKHEAGIISDLTMRSKAYWGYSNEFMQACRKELTVTPENINADNIDYVIAENNSQLLGYYAIEKCTGIEY